MENKQFTIKLLRYYREAQGRTQTYMAKELGYKTSSAYSNIESGRVSLSFKNAVRLSMILDVGLENLFFE